MRWRTTDHCPHSTSIRSATSYPKKRLSLLKKWLGGRCTCRLNSCCHPWLLPLPSAGTEDRNALQTGSYGSHPRVRNSSATCQHSIGRQEDTPNLLPICPCGRWKYSSCSTGSKMQELQSPIQSAQSLKESWRVDLGGSVTCKGQTDWRRPTASQHQMSSGSESTKI